MERESTKKNTLLSLKRLWLPVAIAVVSLCALSYVKFTSLHKERLESKTAHETTATVKHKERVVFDEANRSFINGYNDVIESSPGTEQWRVYYQIDGFNNLPESLFTRVISAERERVASFGARFTYNSKEWYDEVEVGDKLGVTYRALEDGEVEVISVENPQYPSLH